MVWLPGEWLGARGEIQGSLTSAASLVTPSPSALERGPGQRPPLDVVAHLVQERRPSPKFGRVGSHIALYEACSAFTHVPACMLAKPPKAALYTEGFGSIVTSTTAPIATGWSDQWPGGSFTH